MKPATPGDDAPSIRPRSDVRVAGRRCPACDLDVDADAPESVACASCLARHHGDCWRGRGCSACGSERLLATVDPSRRRRRLGLLSIGALAILCTVAWNVVTRVRRAELVEREAVSQPSAEAVTALAHARILLDVPDDEGALRRLDRAIAASPEYAGAYFFRALAHESSHDLRKAEADYTRALELVPRCPPVHPNVICDIHHADGVYLSRGMIRLRLGDALGALEDFDRALELNPGKLDGYTRYHRGVAHLNLGDRSQAARDFERSLALLRPDDPLMGSIRQRVSEARDATPAPPPSGTGRECLARGKARFLELRDLQGAIDDLTRAVELDPSWEAYSYRAHARAELGDLEGAIDDLGRALALAPDQVHLVVRRVSLENRLGRYEAAYDDLVAATPGPTVSRDLRYLRGVAALRLGKAREAVRDFEALVAAPPRSLIGTYHDETTTLYREVLDEARRALGH